MCFAFVILGEEVRPPQVLGMALVFVLLLGEIDLSAGVTFGRARRRSFKGVSEAVSVCPVTRVR